MAITAAQVKELRERTGLGMMDCKKALEEASGDMELAIEELRKKSALKAAKKAGRTTADGLLGLKVSDDGKKGALVEVNIETDFAAKNEKFVAFVAEVLAAVYEGGETDVEKLLEAGLGAKRETLVQEIGENITVRRAAYLAADEGRISAYLHGDNRKGALVHVTVDDDELGRDVAMHVTAINPLVVTSDQVPADVLAKEREIYVSQAADSGKPAEIVEKMVEGRVRKYLAEVSLVDQPFVKDANVKVGKLLEQAGGTCRAFVRFEVGEGIEVEASDFAAEVAAQVKGSS
ncbi:MAG: elongation factor Ts [Gammaproteobacteria bacterium]|nr:elongation factor Ts [Gammaproteobacteria bacterium]|tara:strand:- start:3010 stop:3879 length:870 start_codon:yes stop_codon:yes gene_type:complete